MMSLKRLPPSMRKKQRYIVCKIESEKIFDIGDIVGCLWNNMLEFLGEKGVSEADPWIMKDLFYRDKKIFGIKTGKNSVEDIRTCLALITDINDEKVCIHVKGVSGTLKAARNKFVD